MFICTLTFILNDLFYELNNVFIFLILILNVWELNPNSIVSAK